MSWESNVTQAAKLVVERELAEARAEIERLRVALKQIADRPSLASVHPEIPDDGSEFQEGYNCAASTRAQRAREALGNDEQTGD